MKIESTILTSTIFTTDRTKYKILVVEGHIEGDDWVHSEEVCESLEKEYLPQHRGCCVQSRILNYTRHSDKHFTAVLERYEGKL